MARPVRKLDRMHPELLRAVGTGAGCQAVIAKLATLLAVPVALLDRDGDSWRFAAQAQPALEGLDDNSADALMRIPMDVGTIEDLMAEWTAIPLTPEPTQRILVVPGSTEDVGTPIVQDLIADTSVVLDLVTLREEVARSRQALQRSHALEAALANLAPDESPYEIALAALVEATGAEVGALGVVPVGDKRLSLVVTHGYPSVLVEDVKIEPGEGILGQVLATGAPLVTTDAARDFPQCARRRRYRSGSFLVMPMKSGGEVIGAVSLADRTDGGAFSQRDIEALERLLPAITLAVGRARMHERVKELQYLATLDPLTGLHNRRHFREALAVEVHRARRQRVPLSGPDPRRRRLQGRERYLRPPGRRCAAARHRRRAAQHRAGLRHFRPRRRRRVRRADARERHACRGPDRRAHPPAAGVTLPAPRG